MSHGIAPENLEGTATSAFCFYDGQLLRCCFPHFSCFPPTFLIQPIMHLLGQSRG